MNVDFQWSVEYVASRIVRVAQEGLGEPLFDALCVRFARAVKSKTPEPDRQIRVVVRMLRTYTDTRLGPKDRIAIRLAGLCLVWLAQTDMRTWSLAQVYEWGERHLASTF